jgi:hypothetical protein
MNQLTAASAFALATLAPMTALADCAKDIPIHLEWCSRDHGVNEGATCGMRALSTPAAQAQLPPALQQRSLGNLWDRSKMMGAAVNAYKSGAKIEAINVAVCCQYHNPPAQQCLASRRDIVQAWLAAR